jgi:hypothetical protein
LAPAIDQLFSATEGAVHAKLSEIRVVRFSGCEFTDTRGLSSTGLEYRAKGIESYHSSFNVSNESLFQGLEFGIDATQGLGSPVRFEVTDNCSFDNNLIGINCTGINNIKVTENDFNIGAYPDLQGAAAFHIGMAIENSTGYTVEGNTFLKDNAGGDKTIGIRVYDEDGTESNLVNGNTFDLLNVANQAEGKNTSVLAGLQYFCNTNLGHNTYDFFVSGQGIWPLQGNGLGAENEFSLNSTPDDFSDYNNESNTGITYFCLNEQGKVPVDYFNIEPVLVLQENTCPGDEVGGGSPPVPDPKNDKALLMQGFFNASAGLDSKRTQWITTIDGGDTGGLLGRIAQAAAADSSDLYQLLLSRSPWLSEAALEATIGRHDILSGQKLYGILTANPDGTRDPDIKALVESELSSQLSASIFNNIGGTTARTALLGEIGSYSLERSRYAHALVQQIMDDTIGQEADTLLAWLAQKESRWGDYAAAEMYLEMGDTVSVANLLDAAPGKYGLENQDLLEHEYFEQLLALWQANAANGMNGLDANAQAILKNIANTSTGIAGMKARAILNFAYGGRYFSEPALPGTTPPQWLFRPKLSLSTAATLAAFPNPARDAVTFTFEMPEEVGDAHISVANMGGANVAQIALSGKKGKVNWETSGMADGVYLCNLHFNGQKSATVKVVVMK